MAQDSFANDSTAFVQWLKETPSARISSKIALEDFRSRGAGRGVVASADIAEDEELFTIPRTRVLSVPNSKLQSLLSNELASLGPWLSLMLVMMYEYLHGKDSPWYSYFRVLPHHFDTLIFWNESEIAELQGSAVVRKIGKYDAETSILRKLAPIVRNNQILFPPLGWSMLNWNGPEGDEGLLELAHMMGSLIMAYAFDIEEDAEENGDDADSKADSLVTDDEDDPPKGMVPLADMLNADADLNNARLFHEGGFLTMKAIKPIKAGEEIFNDYGPLPRSDLLRRYGYTSDRYSQYDVVEFSIKSITHACDAAGDVNLDAKLEYLDDMDLFEDGYSVNYPPVNTTLAGAVPEELQFVIMTLLSPEAPKANRMPLKPRFGLSDAKFLKKLVSKRLAEYATKTTEDTAILQTLAQQHAPVEIVDVAERSSQTRKKMAVEVRLGEKRILHRLSELIQSFIADNDESKKRPAANQGTKTKKQKLE